MIRVGLLMIDFHVPDSSSLKEKRSVLRRLKDRIKNSFNVSVSEVDKHDKWQAATLGIAFVSNDKAHIDSTLNKIKDFIEKEKSLLVTGYQIEII